MDFTYMSKTSIPNNDVIYTVCFLLQRQYLSKHTSQLYSNSKDRLKYLRADNKWFSDNRELLTHSESLCVDSITLLLNLDI